jgi:site-specific recombinase XerD
MKPSIPAKSSTYKRVEGPRIGAHHFAHLRAVAEGLPLVESAARYLGIDHGHQAVTAHRTVVEALRALSRRRGDRGWRLLGLTIGLPPSGTRPTLDDFIAERDLDGWSESEVLEMYAQRFPADRRADRRQRLRERQLSLLRALELVAAEVPQSSDRIEGWFDAITTERLRAGGMLLLQDLQERIARGGRWWSGLPAIGATKAERISHYLHALLPTPTTTPKQQFALPTPHNSRPEGRQAAVDASDAPESGPLRSSPPAFSQGDQGGRQGEAQKSPGGALSALVGDSPISPVFPITAPPHPPLPSGVGAMTDAGTDVDIIETWVAARAGSLPTATSYRREARRLLIWLNQERGRSFQQTRVEDCLAYMSFLEHVPPSWSSQQRAHVLSSGWAPFRGPLSLASRRQAVVVLGSFFAWMVDVGYLSLRNPWALVNRRTGDDAQRHELDSRAFTPQAWQAIHAHLDTLPPSPSLARFRFLLHFVEATGLRAAELLSARLGGFRRHKGRLVLQVQGKGSRNRVIAVPGQAEQALTDYLAARGLPHWDEADPQLPLLASTLDTTQAIGYQALYQTMKRWMGQCLRASDLPRGEREDALRASPHWLRHTFGTRALERQAPLEVVQRQLGHADPRTTMRYAKAQLERLQSEMDQAFGGSVPPPEAAPTAA